MKKAVFLMVVVALALSCCLLAFGADAKKGADVYAKNNCKLCHAIAGVGNAKTPLDGVGSKLTDVQLTKWIRTPKEMNPKTLMMPYPVAKISDADLADLVAYMLTLKK
jgi:cytochrome c2